MTDLSTKLAASAKAGPLAHDPEAVLHLPAEDVAEPIVSIVIPAMNEEAVVETFLAWCHEGIAKSGAAVEILIVDSSTDRTAEIALQNGARVLKTPPRGLGRAYQDAMAVIRGRFVIMGDADCTYDFREIQPFVERFQEGYEFVIGSRFAGSIEAGAMPALHRYFGTPLTTMILNVLYGSNFSDIHCGMRGVTTEALSRIDIRSQSWEYASEMVVKSVRLSLKTVEVPVHFYKDRDGRQSHHKRMGWFSPWHAGWINLRAMLVHGADFFLIKPGLMLFVLGLLIALPLAAGPLTVAGVTLSLNTLFLGATFSIVGLQSLFLGGLARSLYDPSGDARRRWLARFPYTPTMVAAGLVFLGGLGLSANFVNAYIGAGYTVFADLIGTNHAAVIGLMMILLSFIAFVSVLLLHALDAYAPKPPDGA